MPHEEESLWQAEAGNPATPADMLVRLAQNQDAAVRRAVASNPNTPWQTLEELAWEFPREFFLNPVGMLQLLANPEQISSDEEFWEALLREEQIPLLWWGWLRSHPTLGTSQVVRLHVQYAGEAASPYEEQDRLYLSELLLAVCAQEASPPTNELAARSSVACRQIVGKYLQHLACSTDVEVRAAIARNEQTPIEILRSLAQDADELVRERVAENKRIPVEVLGILARDENWLVRSGVAGNKQTPLETLRELAQNAGNEGHGKKVVIRRGLAWNEQAPGGMLQLFAQDQDVEVRERVAWNGRTPGEVLRSLAKDQVGTVRRNVAGNKQTPAEVLAILALDQDVVVRRRVAGNEQAPVEALRVLAQDQDVEIRLAVAPNEQAPVEVLATLAQDQSWMVRGMVAGNEQTPLEILQALAQDQDQSVRSAVVGNARAPVEVLRASALDQNWSVRVAVAGNGRTPVEVLRALAQDQVGPVRVAVAKNPQTPLEVLQTLTNDQDTGVQFVANLALWLAVGVRESFCQEGWWKDLRKVLVGDLTAQSTGIDLQVSEVGQLDVSEQMRSMVLATLATGWDARMIHQAFFFYDGFGEKESDHYKCIMAPFMPPIALQKLAACPRWEARYLVALNAQTPLEAKQRLSQDGNRYVRAMARVAIQDAAWEA